MRTEYTFPIETFVKRSDKLFTRTSKAEIVLVPDDYDRKNGELTRALVTVAGSFCFDTMIEARHELMKVLLRNAPKQARIIEKIGMVPDSWRVITEHDGERAAVNGGISILLQGKSLTLYGNLRSEPLKINVDTDSPAVFCYYESMRKSHPVDGFRELFKTIDYFGGARENEKDTGRILASLDKTWWIPDEALSMARNIVRDQKLDRPRLTKYLIDLRGKCSHLRPDYGLTPMDLCGQARIVEMSIVLDMIARHTLEKNPETREPAVSIP